jgi:hypothetical protein
VFEKGKGEFHEKSNAAKNAALYVDVQGGGCSMPSEYTTEAMVEEISDRNEEFLQYANNHVLVLSRWQDSETEFAELARWFIERAEDLRSAQLADPKQAMATLLTEAREKLLNLSVNKKRSIKISAAHDHPAVDGDIEGRGDV